MDLEDLLDSFYGAATNPASWPSCCIDLSRLLRATSSMLFIEDRISQTIMPLAMPDYNQTEICEYSQYYCRVDPFVRAAQSHTRIDAAFGASLVDPADFARSEIWNDFIAKNVRSFHFLCGLRELKPGVVFGVAVHRTPEMEGFTESNRQILQQAVPHMRRALRLGAILERDRISAAAHAAALRLEHSELGIIVCDGNARVRMVNEAGEAICRAHGLRLDGTPAQLDMIRADNRADLHRMIAATASGGPGGKITFRANLASTSISISRLPGTLASTYAPPSAPGTFLVLLLVQAASTRMPPASELRRIFGLTAAEAAVTLSLASGTTGKDVAAQRGVSVTTVRAQVRSILQKAGASNLRDLTRQVASMPH